MKRWVALSLFIFGSLLGASKAFTDNPLTNNGDNLYLCSFSYNEIDNLAKKKLEENSYKKKWLLDYLYNFPVEQYPIFTVPSQGFFAIGNLLDDMKKDLSEKKIYKPHITKAIENHAKKDSTVLDMGAHIGYHTLNLSKAVGNKGRVLAFESKIKLFRELFFNLVLNNIENSSIFLANISDKNQKALTSNLFQDNIDCPSIDAKTFSDQITIDSLNLQNVSLIKINVEQTNVSAIDEMKQTLENNKPIILIEIPDEHDNEPSKGLKTKALNVLEKLKSFNYVIKKISDNYPDYIAHPSKSDHEDCNKKVLLAILARNKAHVLPAYLHCLENLDYDKKQIGVYINTNNNSDNTKEILKDWMKKNEKNYRFLYFENIEYDKNLPEDPHDWNSERFKLLGSIRNESLKKAKEYDCDYYFVVDCDNFIVPSTLKDLIKKDKPIIAPMLRAIPDKNDKYSNYFYETTDSGYYKNHPKYSEILNRSEIGTFKVPVVHCTYLIKSEYIDKLNYIDDTKHHEFVIFSRIARDNNIDQFICNEKTFGYILHWRVDKISLKDEQQKVASLKLTPD